MTAPVAAAPLTVVINGVRNGNGDVLVAVCSERTFLMEHCEYDTKVKASPGMVLVTLEVPPGTWAVQAFHDEARKGQVTYNMFGIPDGGIGFSNDPPFRFKAPLYQDSVFRMGQMGGRISLTLRYLF